MDIIELSAATLSLPEQGWKGLVLAQIANTRLKLFRVDPMGLALECHPAWSESLIMIAGEIRLEVSGSIRPVKAGELVVIPSGAPHAILPGGHGAFLLVDPDGLV